MAYPFAAFVTGYLAERGFDRRYLSSLVAMIAGMAVLFLGGVLWLSYLASGPGSRVGLVAGLETGLYPFIVRDLIEISIASGVLPVVWRLTDSHPHS
jgi:biotin transport system substrate-specific component